MYAITNGVYGNEQLEIYVAKWRKTTTYNIWVFYNCTRNSCDSIDSEVITMICSQCNANVYGRQIAKGTGMCKECSKNIHGLSYLNTPKKVMDKLIEGHDQMFEQVIADKKNDDKIRQEYAESFTVARDTPMGQVGAIKRELKTCRWTGNGGEAIIEDLPKKKRSWLWRLFHK